MIYITGDTHGDRTAILVVYLIFVEKLELLLMMF